MSKLKHAYQRLVRGYDDRIFWGFDGFFETIIVPPLKQFCEDQLGESEQMATNPKSKTIYKKTLALIHEVENQSYDDLFKGDKLAKLAGYFGKNIGYYWD